MPTQQMPFWRRTWIDIDLDRLVSNYLAVCQQTEATVTCVLKSNAYGHGAVRVAQALQEAGCASYAVSSISEALELRQNGISGEILVMGAADQELLPEAVLAGLSMTACSVEDLRAIEAVCAQEAYTAVVHLKMDTGFHRLGFSCTADSLRILAETALRLYYTRIEGIYSHLGLVSPEQDALQFQRLQDAKQALAAHGLVIDDQHICDSLGFVRYPEWHGTRVRIGALLYGSRPPADSRKKLEIRTEETLAFRTVITQIHDVPKGDFVGYSDGTPLPRDTRVATLCAGYGDGYPRSLSNGRGRVMIRGQEAPVIGLVCMDQMMVDVTDIPEARTGDAADLLGGALTYTQCAEQAGTNRNECLTILSRRPVRVYRQHGQIITVTDTLRGICWQNPKPGEE